MSSQSHTDDADICVYACVYVHNLYGNEYVNLSILFLIPPQRKTVKIVYRKQQIKTIQEFEKAEARTTTITMK